MIDFPARCVIWHIWTYTHIKGAWASVDGMQASRISANFPLYTDVGSAKQSREHPPVQAGLNSAIHGLCGFFIIKAKRVAR